MSDPPLVPKTPSGIAFSAVAISIVVAMLGFLGQRALDLDERVIRLQEQQQDDERDALIIRELVTRVAGLEKRLEYRHKTIDLVHEIDERLNRVEAHQEDIKERLRDGRP